MTCFKIIQTKRKLETPVRKLSFLQILVIIWLFENRYMTFFNREQNLANYEH